MTDRHNSLTVILEEPIRSDDIQPLIEAISLFRHVLKVVPGEPKVIEQFIADERAKRELTEKMWQIMYPKASK